VRKRRCLLRLAAALAVTLFVGVLLLWLTAPRISRTNFERIEDGMTLAEVEAILGRRRAFPSRSGLPLRFARKKCRLIGRGM
jgi:hypothetical protein